MNPHTPAQKLHRRLLALGLTAALPFTALAADLTWTGGGASPFNWSDAANWDGDTISAGDNLTFAGGTGATNINNLGDLSLGSLTFTNTATWNTNTGVADPGTISLSEGISVTGTGSVNFNTNITLTADQSFSVTSSNNRTLTIGQQNIAGVFDIGAHDLTVHTTLNNAVTLAYGTVLKGSGDIIKTGTGLLVIRGSAGGNTNFTGNVFVNEGVLEVYNPRALGDVNGTTTVASGATIMINANSDIAEFITIGGTGYGTPVAGSVTRGALSFHDFDRAFTRKLTLSETTTIGFRRGTTISTIGAGIDELAPGAGIEKVGSWGNPSAGFLKLVGSNIAYTGATTVKGGGFIMNGTHGSALNRVAGYLITHETLSQAVSGITGGITSQSALAGTGTVFLQVGEQIVLGGANAAKRAIFAPGDVTAVGGLANDLPANGLTAATGLNDFTSAIGTFTVNAGDAASGVTFGDFSQFSVQIGAAGASDKLVIANGGTLTITGDTLLSISGTLDTDYTYTIAQFGGISGTFLQVDGLAEGWSVVYNANSIELAYGVIPEPSTTGLLAALATLGFVATRRRRAAR